MKECLICQSINQKILFSDCLDLEYNRGTKYHVYQCLNCGLVYFYPTPTIEELLSFYPPDYHSYVKPLSKLTSFLIDLNIRARAKFYKKLIGGKGKVLEIGAADGSQFSILNQNENWDFLGIEFNDEIAAKGRKMGLNIITDTLERHNFGEMKFDLIIMNNLIEHVENPVATLKKAKEILKPAGFIVGDTPNTHSLDFKLWGRCWGGLHIPRHTFLFNQDNLRLLGEKAGLSVEIDQRIDTNHWAGSIQNFCQSKKFLRAKLRNGRAWYYPFLLLIFLPLNFLQKIFGFSGVMKFKMAHLNKENFEEWNEEMARKYNPDIYHHAHNPIIRHIMSQRVKAIVDFLNVQKDDEVIEFGCGAGNILEKINQGRLTGLDLSDFLLAIAREKLKNKKVYLLKGNVENLPAEIKNKKFDKIICSEIIEHVQHPDKVIDEILKIAHSKTAIVISIPNEKFINFLKQTLLKLKVFSFFFPNISKKMDEEWHLHSFDLSLLKNITKEKMETAKIKSIPFWIFPLYYVVKFKI